MTNGSDRGRGKRRSEPTTNPAAGANWGADFRAWTITTASLRCSRATGRRRQIRSPRHSPRSDWLLW